MTPADALPLTQWIIGQGLEGTPETRFLDGLCERLKAAGMPLLRVNLCLPTLHPVIGGHLFIWRRDQPAAVEEDWGRNVAAAGGDASVTPFGHMMQTRETAYRARLSGNEPSEFRMLDRFRSEGATDYLALQTIFGEAHRLGPANRVLTSWLTDAPGGFDEKHVALVEQIAPVIGLAAKSASTLRVARSLIEAYLGKDPGQRVLSGTIERGAGETIRAALWSCDLQGFTKIADKTPRDRLLSLMHDYFETMVTTIDEHDGHVLKFIGDGILAIFNTGDDVKNCRAALVAADRVIGRVTELTAKRQAEGLPFTRFYIGLHIGDVLYGNIGAPNRLDFTVIGPAVNEVSRMEAMCRALDQDLVISSAFAKVARNSSDRLVSLGRYALRGVRQPQELFTLAPAEGG